VNVVWLIAGWFLLGISAASSEEEGRHPPFEMVNGAIVRGSVAERKIALVFTGHEFAEGAQTILDELNRRHARGSFFVTGPFLANTNFSPIVQRIIREGHYLGPHSDQHLLYLPWDGSTNLLVDRTQFSEDLEANLRKIETAGVSRKRITCFLPPYEHYNATIAAWTKTMGLTLVNFTPGTRSNADYTGEQERNFVSSQRIFDSILTCESRSPAGLNGFLLLLHLGAGPTRTDKFHRRFGELLGELEKRGYHFVRVDELLCMTQ